MRTSLISILLLVCVPAHAVVNLDEPLNAGVSDKVYRSSLDPKIAYYFPIGIARLGGVTYSKNGERLVARFDGGIPRDSLEAVLQALAQRHPEEIDLRIFRPISFEIEKDGATDIEAHLDPVLTPLGDLDLLGPMPYSLSVLRKKKFLRKSEGKEALRRVFSDGGQDHIGMIRYEFNALLHGKPHLGRTAVGVFSGNRSKLAPHPLGYFEPDVPIQRDEDSRCWERVMPGSFCVRQQ